MSSTCDLQLCPSISDRFELVSKLTELARVIEQGLGAGRLKISATVQEAMSREFILMQVADSTRKVSLELTKLDLTNPWRVQKRLGRAWQAADMTKQSA